MHRGDRGGVQVLVVNQQDVVVGVPAVLIAPGELQRDDVPRDAKASPEPLPGRSGGDVLPCGALGIDEL